MTAEQDLATRLSFLEIDEATRAALRDLEPVIDAALPRILDQFYVHLDRFPETANIVPTSEIKGRAREAQLNHWKRLVSGRFDADYVASVRRVGETHARLGLGPRWYIGGYAFMTSRLLAAVSERINSRFGGRAAAAKRTACLAALNRAALLDMDLALSVFHEASELEKNTVIANLIENFETKVVGYIDTISRSAAELHETAAGLLEGADRTSAGASGISTAAEQASENVQAIAAAAEELSAAVSEIAGQVQQANRIANSAVTDARATKDVVNTLAEAASKIGTVVTLIKEIADQTNLLALNATIEAARAGEAGKGFAVVANEVKSLANQTTKATDEIGQEIAAMQEVTDKVVLAIERIGGSIEEINEVSGAIAAAIEEQAATTSEVARNTQQATVGTGEVSRGVGEVRDVAAETGSGARHLVEASAALSGEATHLRERVDEFLQQVRTA
jgi:methyl-accepting chemotaxis protein